MLDARRSARVARGSALLTRVTGTGCLLGALTAACAAVHDDPFEAALTATLWLDLAGETAAERAQGPGSFRVHLLDALDEQPMPPRPGEPDDFEGIQALWRDVPRWDSSADPKRMEAAWIGRAAGCYAGRAAGSAADGVCDDLTYTVLALRLVERVGPDFTTEDVAQAWLDEHPDAPAGLRRHVAESRDTVARAVTAQERDADSHA